MSLIFPQRGNKVHSVNYFDASMNAFLAFLAYLVE